MGEIKGYMFSSVAFILLAISFACVFFLAAAYLIDGELETLTANLRQAISPLIESNIQKTVDDGSLYPQLVSACSSPGYPESLAGICGMMESGKINDSASLGNYMSSEYVSAAISTSIFKNLQIVESVRSAGPLAAFVIFVTFFMSAFLLYLAKQNASSAVSTLAFYSGAVSSIFLAICISLVLAVPMFAGIIASKEKLPDMDFTVSAQYAVLVKTLADWLAGYVLRIAAVYLALAIVSFSIWQLAKPTR